MSEYTGPDRRRGMGDVDKLLEQLERFMVLRFEQMEKKIDDSIRQTRAEIDTIRAQVENLHAVYDSKNRNDHEGLWTEIDKLKVRVGTIETKPGKELEKAKEGFLKSGQEVFTRAFWGIAVLFVGFLIWDFIQKGGIKP